MNATERFDHYLGHLSEGLGHADRHAGLRGYCTGLMLPLSRKSVEPMAARVDPITRAPDIKRCTTSWPRHSGPMKRCFGGCAGG